MDKDKDKLEITGEMLDEQVRKALYVLLTRSMQEGLGTSAAGFATAFKQIVDSMDELRAKRVFDEPSLTRVVQEAETDPDPDPDLALVALRLAAKSARWRIDGDMMTFYDEHGNVTNQHSLKAVPQAAKIEKPEVFVYAIRRKTDGSWYTRSRGFTPTQNKARIYRRKCDASSSFNKNHFSQTTCEVVRFGCLET